MPKDLRKIITKTIGISVVGYLSIGSTLGFALAENAKLHTLQAKILDDRARAEDARLLMDARIFGDYTIRHGNPYYNDAVQERKIAARANNIAMFTPYPWAAYFYSRLANTEKPVEKSYSNNKIFI